MRRSTAVRRQVEALGVKVLRAMEVDRGPRRLIRLTVAASTPPLPGEVDREPARDIFGMPVPGKVWSYFAQEGREARDHP